jgi:hypothetical protein
MALPTLNATFASAADLPRRQMLARWLVGELGSGSVADYWLLPERYLWAKIAVAAGGSKTEATYISLPTRYVWSDIYNAISGSSAGTIDWSEKEALGRITAAYRGDTGNPANLATYIDWPWRYQVASIITELSTPSGPTFPSDGLLAFWRLDNLTDSSGNGNTLTNNNSVVFVEGKIGNSAQFDGSNYLSLSTHQFPTGNSNRTFSCWVKTSQSNGLNLIFSYGIPETSNEAFGLGLLDGNAGFFSQDNDFVTSSNISDNNWHHLVLTHSSENGRTIYLDGTNIGNDSDSINTGTNSIFRIGTWTYAFESTSLTGLVDAIGVWDRVISLEEINTIYNNGTGLEP